MANIAIFYHLYQHGDWRLFFNEQSSLLNNSGLVDACEFVHVGVNGEDIPESHGKFRFVKNAEPLNEETPTLVSLRDFCASNPRWKVLYMHTKGITQPMQSTHDWRKIMEYYCIERWQECVEKLDEHDAVGCLYMDHCYYGYFPHFSGNFWWANSDYINKLDNSYLNTGIRQNREFWIGSGGGSLYSFHTTGLNHYAHEYPRHLYAN
jgi:hypothetical protein